jgi:glycosyltransferase involved in cell wall biosynthesis
VTGLPRLVAFDATPLELPNPSGVGQYVACLLGALRRHPRCPPLALLAARPLPPALLEGTLGQPGPRVPNRTVWMQAVLPWVLRRLAPRVTHFTNFVSPVVSRQPYVTTIHDMSLYLYPQTQATRHIIAARPFVALSARRAAAVVTVSESAKADIVRVLDLSPDRVRVLSPAASPEFAPIGDPAILERVRARYGLSAPFLLFVGSIEPRKNLSRLFDAFALVRAEHPDLELVLAGGLGWKYGPILAHRDRLGLASSIRLLGYLNAADLPVLYNLAAVVVLPSLYEGFGLPILEAMASGVPVVTSRTGAMAEVAGDAAILVDPDDAEGIATGIRQALEDTDRRTCLRAKGLRRAATFSWERTADEFIRLYDEVGDRALG